MEVKFRMEVWAMLGGRQRAASRIRRVKAGEFWQCKEQTRRTIPTDDELRRLHLEIGRRAEAAGLTEEDVIREVEAYRAGR